MNHRAIPRAAPRSCRARPAAGYTLIELLVAITVGGAILTVAATLMSRVIAANSTAEEHLRAIASLGEIGRRFREDVHRATVATVESTEPPRLVLTLDDGSQVQYDGASNGAARVQTVAGGPTRHEAYALGNYEVLGFSNANAANGEVQMLLGRVASRPDDDTISGEFAITAVAPGPIALARPQEAPAP
jgi:prepilin-type N-terminal cleavage/methylation domain-containing protein